MDRDHVRRLLREQIEELWGRGRTELVTANYSDTVIDHMPVPGQPAGRAAMADVVRAFRAGLPDLRLSLHGTIACGTTGVDWWTLEGTHSGPLLGVSPTGARVRMSGIDWVRIGEDRRIAELWHVEDMLSLAGAIGAQPSAFAEAGDAADAPLAPPDPGAHAAVPDPNSLTREEWRALAVARRHLEQMWALGRIDLAPELYVDDVVDHAPAPGQRSGIPGLLDVLIWLREAAPDLRLTVDAYAVEGPFVADRWRMTGTHSGAPLFGVPARGRRFAIYGMDVIRVGEDGRITDVWHAEELARLKAQVSA